MHTFYIWFDKGKTSIKYHHTCTCIISLHLSLRQGMRLYLVWDSEGISEQTDTIVEDLFQSVDCDSDDEGPQKKSLKIKRKREPSSSKSSKESSEEGSASSSDQEAFRCEIWYQFHSHSLWTRSDGIHCMLLFERKNCQWHSLACIRLQVFTVCISQV